LQLLVWASDYAVLRQKLEIVPDIKINVLVEADFWVPSGSFRAKILDIDPAYTLGELARTRQAILQRLSEEGLLRKNARLPMPLLPLRVGLVTAEGSAAWHDFTTTLAASGFAFAVSVEFAWMQGAETESTVLAALGRLRQDASLDVVCVVRGGGGKTDLNYFDSEALCRAVADFPTPVLTGIGHEIDSSLLDLVAWRQCITPTDCAKFLVEAAADAWDRARRATDSVARLARLRLQGEQERAARNASGLQMGVRKILDYQKMRLDLLSEKVWARDPARQLERGYAMVLGVEGRLLRRAADLVAGDAVALRFADGERPAVISSF
jgi:exodeoxyribonuclease VII large subunit